jgi:hypothetical protein
MCHQIFDLDLGRIYTTCVLGSVAPTNVNIYSLIIRDFDFISQQIVSVTVGIRNKTAFTITLNGIALPHDWRTCKTGLSCYNFLK